MATTEKMLLDIKWATRQRLQYIEIMAFYTGIITRSDVTRAFGVSDPAATKDLKLYNDLAQDNLIYRHSVFGFVPSEQFQPLFEELSARQVLPMIASNLAVSSGPYADQSIYGIPAEHLPLPERLPNTSVLAQITRAIRQSRKLQAQYLSLSDRDSSELRIIEPHSLINNGLRWHVRAYSQDSYDFRDFVLSRFTDARMLDEAAESSADYDEDWTEMISLKLTAHPGLKAEKRQSLLMDYAAENECIEITTRRALVGYLLQRLAVDTSPDHSMNPHAHQLIILNRDEIEPFAAWAFQ